MAMRVMINPLITVENEQHWGEDCDPSHTLLTITVPVTITTYTMPALSPYKSWKCLACPRRALYGILQQHPLHCPLHRFPDERNVVDKRCWAIGCKLVPSFGSHIDRVKKHCSAHRVAGEVNLAYKKDQHICQYDCTRCQGFRCQLEPAFGSSEDGVPRYCKDHRVPGDVPLRSPLRLTSCNVIASFGDPADRIRRYCVVHRRITDVNLVNRICEYSGKPCYTRPSFGSFNDGRIRFCRTHRRPRDINLNYIRKVCEVEGCPRRVLFGSVIDGVKHRCVDHKSPGDVNLAITSWKTLQAKLQSTAGTIPALAGGSADVVQVRGAALAPVADS